MKIAICDDSIKDLENLYQILLDYYKDKDFKVSIEKFNNPKILLNKLFLEGSETYDVFILDIVMQQNGIDVAKKINNIYPHATIIFQTSSVEYAIDAFKVRAMDYILKPLDKNQVFDCLDRLVEETSSNKRNVCQIKTSDLSLITLDIKEICFIESLNRRLIFHMVNGHNISSTSLRTKFLESIPFDFEAEQFVLCHNSYIVNMNQIKLIKESEFIMFNNQIVPISRRMIKEVKERYTKYLLGEQ